MAGKGINVARALQTMGLESHLFLFLGGENGNKVARGLSQECLPFDAWPTLEKLVLPQLFMKRKYIGIR